MFRFWALEPDRREGDGFQSECQIDVVLDCKEGKRGGRAEGRGERGRKRGTSKLAAGGMGIDNSDGKMTI